MSNFDSADILLVDQIYHIYSDINIMLINIASDKAKVQNKRTRENYFVQGEYDECAVTR